MSQLQQEVSTILKSSPSILRRLFWLPVSVVFYFVLFVVTFGFLSHTLWMAFDVRLYAIRGFGTIIHEFDPWFNYRSLEYFEKQLRIATKKFRVGGNFTKEQEDNFYEEKFVGKSITPKTHEFYKHKWADKNSLTTLADRYFHQESWSFATREKFFKWFDHESWYPLGRPVGTTIYPGMQLFTSALFRALKMGNHIAKAQEYNIASWVDKNNGTTNNMAALKALPEGDKLAFRDGSEALDSDTVSWLVKNILYQCRTKDGKMRNCLQRWQKIFKKQLLKGNFAPLGLEKETIDSLYSIFVDKLWYGTTFLVTTLPDSIPIISQIKSLITWAVWFIAYDIGFVRLVYNPFLSGTVGTIKEYRKRVMREYEMFYDHASSIFEKNWNWLLFKMPDKALAVLRHDWTLNEVACYVPALSGPAASLGVGLLAAATVAQPESSFDYTRYVTLAFTFIMGVFFMSVIPAHAQRSVGGGYDNECIAVAPMCLAGFFYVKSIQHNISGVRSEFADIGVRIFYAILAGLSHAFMAAGWGGYVFLINLISAHAGAMFILERFGMYNNEPGSKPHQRFNELYYSFTVFYIVGTSIAIQFPVVGWAPLRSLEQILGLAVFLLLNIVKLGDLLFSSSLTKPKIDNLLNNLAVKRAQFFKNPIVGQVFTLRTLSLFIALVGAGMCYGTAMDVDNFWFLKLMERFFIPLTGRVKSLFGFHAVRTGNPLIDSVSEHQASNDSIYWRTLNRTMYMAVVGMLFLSFDLLRMGVRWLVYTVFPLLACFTRDCLAQSHGMGTKSIQTSSETASEKTISTESGSAQNSSEDANSESSSIELVPPFEPAPLVQRLSSTASTSSVRSKKGANKKDSQNQNNSLDEKPDVKTVLSQKKKRSSSFSEEFAKGGVTGVMSSIADKGMSIFLTVERCYTLVVERYMEFSENSMKQKELCSKVIGDNLTDVLFGGNRKVEREVLEKYYSSSQPETENSEDSAPKQTQTLTPELRGKALQEVEKTLQTLGLQPIQSPLLLVNYALQNLGKNLVSLLLGPDDASTPVATAGMYFIIFGWTTYMFSLKMARLIIFLGPTSSGLAAVACGRVAQWIFEPIRLITFKPDTYDKVEGKKISDSVKTIVGKNKTSLSASSHLVKASAYSTRLLITTLRAVVCLSLAFRYGIYTHLQAFVISSWQIIEHAMSHPQIVSHNNDGTLKDDYREAYWWIRDNTPEDARILSWWDYGYQLAGLSKRITVADGNTWNHEHLAFLGLSLTSPVEEAHMIHRHWADYVLVWTDSDLSKATHMARISNSVYKGHCYDKLCLQFSWTQQGPSDMMKNSFMFAVTNGAQNLPTNQKMKSRYKEVFVSKLGAVRIMKVLQVSQKSKRLGSAQETKKCDAPGSWFCPGTYPPALHALREVGFHGFGWTISGEQAQDTKDFTITTTPAPLDGETVVSEEVEVAGDDKTKKLEQELKRYRELFSARVEANLAMGPKANGKQIPKGDYITSCGGCRLHESPRKTYYHDLDTLGIKKTYLKCTHCETGGHPRESRLEMTNCYDFHEAFKSAGGERYAYNGWGKEAILNNIVVSNNRGQLMCRHKPHAHDVPEGGYRDSCVACLMEHSKSGTRSTLRCDGCSRSDGGYNQPIVFKGAKKCADNGGWIQNKDGKLSCTRDRPPAKLYTPSGLSHFLHSTGKSLDTNRRVSD